VSGVAHTAGFEHGYAAHRRGAPRSDMRLSKDGIWQWQTSAAALPSEIVTFDPCSEG
jgi:hypothetical protein